jgi:hypothetical protein
MMKPRHPNVVIGCCAIAPSAPRSTSKRLGSGLFAELLIAYHFQFWGLNKKYGGVEISQQ